MRSHLPFTAIIQYKGSAAAADFHVIFLQWEDMEELDKKKNHKYFNISISPVMGGGWFLHCTKTLSSESSSPPLCTVWRKSQSWLVTRLLETRTLLTGFLGPFAIRDDGKLDRPIIQNQSGSSIDTCHWIIYCLFLIHKLTLIAIFNC